jgi:hypothetical protein
MPLWQYKMAFTGLAENRSTPTSLRPIWEIEDRAAHFLPYQYRQSVTLEVAIESTERAISERLSPLTL